MQYILTQRSIILLSIVMVAMMISTGLLGGYIGARMAQSSSPLSSKQARSLEYSESSSEALDTTHYDPSTRTTIINPSFD